MKDFFKPKMFNGIEKRFRPENYAADVANQELQKMIESWPVVYGSKFISNDGSAFDIGSVWNITKISDKTHSARLMVIEEIKKECVKHEPGAYQAGLGETIRCCHCNVPLIAEWREVK